MADGLDPATTRATFGDAGAGVRRAEVVAALSLATDLGSGRPLESALRTCLVAVRLAEVLGLDRATQNDVYHVSLLAWLGCTAEAVPAAEVFGDELAFAVHINPMLMGEPHERAAWMLRHVAAGEPALRRARLVVRALSRGPGVMARASEGHCEAGQLLAGRLGFGPTMVAALGAVFERWDGTGFPRQLRGAALPLVTRVMHVASDLALFWRPDDPSFCANVVHRRAGRAFDPDIVASFEQHASSVLEALEAPSIWQAALAAEPGGPRALPAEWLDTAAMVYADFVDLKSDYTAQHSRCVAELAASAARQYGLGERVAADVWRAGLLHDLGRVTVSAGVWDKPGPLNEAEREKVRLHAYYTERICSRASALATLGMLAGLHHERLDGSGYHRAARASMLAPGARVLAAADAFQAMTERRPHRPALALESAVEELQRDADAGRLDQNAVRAVIESVGQRPRRARGTRRFGLSDREVEVLTWLTQGWSTKEIASRLVVSPKTVDHHVQHIYAKLDVRSRAGVRLFATQHGLVDNGVF